MLVYNEIHGIENTRKKDKKLGRKEMYKAKIIMLNFLIALMISFSLKIMYPCGSKAHDSLPLFEHIRINMIIMRCFNIDNFYFFILLWREWVFDWIFTNLYTRIKKHSIETLKCIKYEICCCEMRKKKGWKSGKYVNL